MSSQIQGANRLNLMFYDYAWEDFTDEIYVEFREHIGKSYVVTSKNHGWNNATVKGKFILNNVDDIFRWFPNTDWRVVITKKTNAKNTYHFEISEHDGTSNYKIVFKRED